MSFRSALKAILVLLVAVIVATVITVWPLVFDRPNSFWSVHNVHSRVTYADQLPSAGKGRGLESMATTHDFCNFDRSTCCNATVHFPTTVEEVQVIVKKAAETRSSVRVVGGGHAMSAAVCTPFAPQSSKDKLQLLSLDRMNRVLEVNRAVEDGNETVSVPTAAEVTVEAGIRLRHLNDALHYLGLRMKNLGLIDEQSIAGATATGTHGTGIRYPSLSNAVAGMELVVGNGSVVWLDEVNHNELFQYAKIHLGLFGVVTKLRLKVAKAALFRRFQQFKPMEELWKDLKSNLRDVQHYQFSPFTGTGLGQVQAMEEWDGDSRSELAKEAILSDTALTFECFKTDFLYTLMLQVIKLFPTLRITKIMPYVDPSREFIARSDRILNFPGVNYHSVQYSEEEFFVPLQNAEVAFNELDQFIEKNPKCFDVGGHPIRFVAGDNLPLSPLRGMKSGAAAISFVLFAPYSNDAFLSCGQSVERIMLKYGARPHWGKRFFLTPEEIKQLYGEKTIETFAKHVKLLDPESIFSADGLQTQFGIQ